MVWVETPTNPLLTIVDIAAVAELAHARGARVVVDNTFATPYLQQPLALGADVVVHSSTKYLGGHSDVVGGFVAVDDDELAERIALPAERRRARCRRPFDCYLVLRGIKTLAVRMERHCDERPGRRRRCSPAHPAVARVLYPGLPDHPGHDVARAPDARLRRHGVVHRSPAARTPRSTSSRATRLFTLAESLGAVESLIEHPARMTHASAAGSPLAVDPALVRLSVGIETADDLVADLRAGARRAWAETRLRWRSHGTIRGSPPWQVSSRSSSSRRRASTRARSSSTSTVPRPRASAPRGRRDHAAGPRQAQRATSASSSSRRTRTR